MYPYNTLLSFSVIQQKTSLSHTFHICTSLRSSFSIHGYAMLFFCCTVVAYITATDFYSQKHFVLTRLTFCGCMFALCVHFLFASLSFANDAEKLELGHSLSYSSCFFSVALQMNWCVFTSMRVWVCSKSSIHTPFTRSSLISFTWIRFRVLLLPTHVMNYIHSTRSVFTHKQLSHT